MEMMDRHRIGIDELMRQWLVYRGISPQSASLVERLTYRQLYALSDSGRKERSRTVSGPALVVDSYQDSSYYVFDYKSNPSTTGLRHKGYIKFIRPQNRSVPKGEDIECVVDCSCPDYKFRFAWANKQRGSGVVGPNSLNQAWNRAPRITNPTGRPALCKHLLALADSIFGWMVEFRGNPEGGTINVGLDRLTKRMQRRWVNFGDEVKRARERNSRISQDRAARQVGNNPYNTYNRMTGTTIPNADDLIEPPEGPDQTTTEQ